MNKTDLFNSIFFVILSIGLLPTSSFIGFLMLTFIGLTLIRFFSKQLKKREKNKLNKAVSSALDEFRSLTPDECYNQLMEHKNTGIISETIGAEESTEK